MYKINKTERSLQSPTIRSSSPTLKELSSSLKTLFYPNSWGFLMLTATISMILLSFHCSLYAQWSPDLINLQVKSAPTQGDYAVKWSKKLGLEVNPKPQEAVESLVKIGIEPEGGWNPNAPADVEFFNNVESSLIQATQRGYITTSQLIDVLNTIKAKRPAELGLMLPGEVNEPNYTISAVKKAKEPTELSPVEAMLSGLAPNTVPTDLRQFGYNVFRGPVPTFAPLTNVPVGPDYVIGPGDSFRLTLWGRVNAQYTVVVDRNGQIALPDVGVLTVAGMEFSRLQDYLKDQLSRKYTDFKLAVTMARLRTITVYVVGEARTPGSYTLSSLSTVINALFAAGGPSKNGTLRKIQVFRNHEKIATIDLYNFLLGGDKSEDVRLQNGDTIFIPLIGPVVGVAGNVKRPAIYEMTEPMTLAQVLELAGGVTYAGWLQRVQVERVEAHQRRIVVDFNISQADKLGNQRQANETIIQDGDLIKVFPVLPVEQNVVYLEGHVYRPGKYELKPGMRLRDILTSYDVLQPQPNLEYGEIVRFVKPDLHPVVIPFNVGKLLEGDQAQNIELRQFDRIRVFRWDQRVKRIVSISGMVFRPGKYRLVPGMRVRDLIDAAGGLMKNAYLKKAEITRRYVTQSGMRTEKIEVDLEKALQGDAEHNIALRDYDYLIVRPIPELEFDRVATIEGEVKFPGTYPIRKGETLSSLIERAGGFTERAYLRGAVFTRESARAVQRQKMDELIRQMEEALLTHTERVVSGSLSDEQAKIQQQLSGAQKELLAKLKAAKIEGRVVIKLAPLEKFRGSKYDLELEKGDKLVVPEKPGIVNVVGEVYNPGALLYEENKTVGYYLSKVGGPNANADKKHISVIRADGSVASMSQKSFRNVTWDSQGNRWLFGGFMNIQLNPGDTIVVPRKFDKYAWLRNVKDITQVLFQIAVTTGVVLAL